MRELCHRCHGELPASITGDSPLVFCPHCAAPQLLLSESVRIELPVAAPTTGALPPPRPIGFQSLNPRPGQVDWRAAIAATGLVAAIGAALLVGGLEFSAVSLLSVIWTMSGAVIALGLYSRSRPRAWMDARIGLRVGSAAGLLMIAAMSIALAGTGVIMRFGTHSLGSFDADIAQVFEVNRQHLVQMMQQQNQPADLQARLLGLMNSPEFHAGFAMTYIALLGGIILLLSAGGGAFAGMLRASHSPRPGLRRGD
jgi:hypothetical protein